MTKREAKEIFDTNYYPIFAPQGKVALRTAWNDFVDSLYKDGSITEHQSFNWRNPYDKD